MCILFSVIRYISIRTKEHVVMCVCVCVCVSVYVCACVYITVLLHVRISIYEYMRTI